MDYQYKIMLTWFLAKCFSDGLFQILIILTTGDRTPFTSLVALENTSQAFLLCSAKFLALFFDYRCIWHAIFWNRKYFQGEIVFIFARQSFGIFYEIFGPDICIK